MNRTEKIRNNWKHIDAAKESLDIILIAHVDEPRGSKNTLQLQCEQNEFFRIHEFNEIYQGIVNAGFFMRNVFFNEIDFIENAINNPNQYDSNTLVFTLARNGKENSKKALIPAFCDLRNLNYTSSSSFGCSMARNKYYFTALLNALEIPTPISYYYVGNNKWLDDKRPETDNMLIIKPSNSSASQGISMNSICKASDNDFMHKINTLFIDTKFPVLVQQYIIGEECEVPIIQYMDEIIPLMPVMIVDKNHGNYNILTSEISDNDDYDFEELSNRFSLEVIEQIEGYAIKAFQALNLTHYGRIDFRVDSLGNPYIIDVSTTPYITKHSSFAFAFEKMSLEYCDIFSTIITAALL